MKLALALEFTFNKLFFFGAFELTRGFVRVFLFICSHLAGV